MPLPSVSLTPNFIFVFRGLNINGVVLYVLLCVRLLFLSMVSVQFMLLHVSVVYQYFNIYYLVYYIGLCVLILMAF